VFSLAVVLVAAGGAVVAIVNPFATHKPSNSVVADNAERTSLYTVAREDLSAQTQVSATLGYAGSYSVVNQAQGTVTSLPGVGQVVADGQVLYEVNGAPVVLLTGSTPAYRTLSEGASVTDVAGPDVEELNYDLVALGYITSADLEGAPSDFGYWTKVGVETLQSKLGVTQNGTLNLGQVAFVPTAARITSLTATLGGPAQSGQTVLSATSTTRQVNIALDAAEQSEVTVGDKVAVTLPNNQTTPGVIVSVGTVATTPSGGGSPTVTVLVNPTDPTDTGTWDQAPVNVTITASSVANALAVPVDALLAQSNGTYAVEVVGAHGIHRLVSVTLGLFDDANGMVQITGSSLEADQRAVIPAL
jgi:hypothetical protein